MITQYNIDTTVITPDRSYTISNPDKNKAYDGKYILMDKQEIFRREDEKYFTSTVTMKFAKIRTFYCSSLNSTSIAPLQRSS